MDKDKELFDMLSKVMQGYNIEDQGVALVNLSAHLIVEISETPEDCVAGAMAMMPDIFECISINTGFSIKAELMSAPGKNDG